MLGFSTTNNASGLLLSSLGASGTTAILETGQGDLFPSTFPFLCYAEKIVSSVVTQREIIKVTNKSGDNLTIIRSAGTCPPNDSSTTPGTTAFDFDAGDRISLYVTAEIIQDLYSGILDKLNKDGELRTGNGTWKIIYNDGSGDETELALDTAGKVLTSNGVSSAPTFEITTVDISSLAEKTVPELGDYGILLQTFGGTNYKFTLENLSLGLFYATSDKQGVVELATDGEATTGTSTTLPITVKQAKDNYSGSLTAGATATFNTQAVETGTITIDLGKTFRLVQFGIAMTGNSSGGVDGGIGVFGTFECSETPSTLSYTSLFYDTLAISLNSINNISLGFTGKFTTLTHTLDGFTGTITGVYRDGTNLKIQYSITSFNDTGYYQKYEIGCISIVG